MNTIRSIQASQGFRSDRGFTLVELMVYVGLVTLVLLVAGNIFDSLLKVQNTVVGSTSAAENAQVVTRNLENGLRNGTAVSLQSVGSSQLVLARTAGNGNTTTWQCDAWYWDATTNQVRFKSSANQILTPTAAELATWQLLSTGVTPLSGTSIFTLSGSRLAIAFNAAAAGTTKVAVQTAVTVQAGTWVSSPCF